MFGPSWFIEATNSVAPTLGHIDTMSTSHTDANQEASSLTEVMDDELFINTNHSPNVENDLPMVCITSYGHRLGPLLPTPDISIDLRTLPHPPKNIRTGQTGRSKPLRDWMFSDEEVLRRFDHICTQIASRMKEALLNEEQCIKVGVCCEIGKHRSVAVVEELNRIRFDGWNVVIGHRDVHRKRSSRKKGHREAGAREQHSN